jgi:hypothetical protein
MTKDMGTDTVKDMNKVTDMETDIDIDMDTDRDIGHGALNFANEFAVTTHCYYKLSRTYKLLNLYTKAML